MTHGLDTHVRTSHTVAGIRGSRYPAPQIQLGEQPTAVVVPLRRAALRTVRDGTTRPAALGALDDHQRLSVRAVLTALGWDAGTDLVATVEDGHGVIRAGRVDHPALTTVRAPDGAGRLSLPPFLAGALDVRAGDQVLVVAVLSAGELHLHAGVDVMQSLTGPVAPTPQLPAARPFLPPASGRGRVAPRFGHAAVSV
jgi:hypothetical protein